jgi:dihydrofolate reductase
MTIFSMIVAKDALGGIGIAGRLPWGRHEQDMNWFVRHTKNKPVVMGRKTFYSLPNGPLANRRNIILSSSIKEVPEGTEVYQTVEDIVKVLEGEVEVVIIGGAKTYTSFEHLIGRVYLTEFHAVYPSDLKIEIDMDLGEWDVILLDHFSASDCAFHIYQTLECAGLNVYVNPGAVSER